MLLESGTPSIASPPPPPRQVDPEALFEEARQRRRERRLRLGLIAALLAIAAVAAYAAFGSGTKASVAGYRSQLPIVTASNPTVVLLVDVSGSMAANDIKPSRIDAVRTAMRILIADLPKRSKVGVIAFSSYTDVLAAPTLDRNVVAHALDRLTPESGTALGTGLAAAVQLAVGSLDNDGVHRAVGHYLPALVILASDGAQNRGALSPLQAADRAKAAGVRIDGIALGTPRGTVRYGYGQYHESIAVPPDPKTVRSISRVTGGGSFVALTPARLDSIYRTLGSSIGR
jgi:Ca-activated chloride channel homolog